MHKQSEEIRINKIYRENKLKENDKVYTSNETKKLKQLNMAHSLSGARQLRWWNIVLSVSTLGDKVDKCYRQEWA